MTIDKEENEAIYKAYCTFKGSKSFINQSQFSIIKDTIHTARTYSWGYRDVVGVYVKADVGEEVIETILEIADELGLTEIESERDYHHDTGTPKTLYFTRDEDYDQVVSSGAVKGGA